MAASKGSTQTVIAPATEQGSALDITLVEAVALGLRSNWTVRSLYVQRIAQRYELWVAEQRFVPRIQASGDAEYDRTDGGSSRLTTIGGSGTWLAPTGASVDFAWNASARTRDGVPGFSQTRTVSLTQPLLRGAGVAINMIPIRLARLQEDINRLSTRNTVATIITSIVTAYRNLIQARDQVEVAKASLDRSRQQLDINKMLVETGRMAAADLVQNEADIANQEVALLQAQRSTDTARLQLLRLLALDLHTRIGQLDGLKPERVMLNPEHLAEIAKEHRVDLLTQEKTVQQAQFSLEAAKNDRLWDVNAVSSYSSNVSPSGDQIAGMHGKAVAAGIQVTIPLLDPGRASGEVTATAALRSAELQRQDLDQEVEAEIRDGAAQVDSNWQQLKTSDRAYDLAVQALSLVRQKLRVGRSSNFEVVTYESNLRDAETQRLTATVNYLNSLTTLDQQLGTTTDTWHIELND